MARKKYSVAKKLVAASASAALLLAIGCSGPMIDVAQPAQMDPKAGQTTGRAALPMAENFTVTDHRGNTVSLEQEKAEATVVLVFYRGSW